MPIKKFTNKNYTENSQIYQLKLPLELSGLIPEDDSVRLLSQILEELNYTKLHQAYSAKGRNPVVDPKTMFKILIYAYSQNIYSTHKIEAACKRDINFMWLLAGQKAPDHSTIARFRQKYVSDAVEDLFYQIVNLLHELKEIEYENVFIDGTKIEANANKYTFVWKKTVNKNESKMFDKITALTEDLNKIYTTSYCISRESVVADIQKVLTYLNDKQKESGVEFVYGTGKRKSQLQRFIEKFQEFKERQEQYDVHNSLFEDRNSYSKTDTDATFMHMKDDHMRNAQLKPAYNVQIGVESEYVVGVGIFQDRSDSTTMIPFLEDMKLKYDIHFKNIIADSGYESEENYLYLDENGQKYYIKPQSYEQWKKKSFKKDISKRENMFYDLQKDEYTCHNGKQLKFIGTTHRTSASGFRSEISIYECEDCSSCPHKQKCTKAKGNRRMQVSKTFVQKRQISYENITTEKGILLRVNRSIQVEGAFGVLKNDYNFNRFLTRGKNNVKTEFLLLCFGYNVNKLHAKIQNGRCGKELHDLKEA